MKKNALEFWVGLFVLLGAAAIGFLAFRAAGGQSFGKSSQTYTVYADFSDIGGLKTNAPVKSAGVLVGRVASIQLDPKSYQAKVALNLENLIGKFMTSFAEKNADSESAGQNEQ